jgi:hypothetical protein
VIDMPFLAKGFLVLMKTRTGRKLLFATTIGVLELALSEQAHKVYAKAADDARRAARAVRRRAAA